MSRANDIRFPTGVIRDDYIPKDSYFSREFAQFEEERLWPKVWQIGVVNLTTAG